MLKRFIICLSTVVIIVIGIIVLYTNIETIDISVDETIVDVSSSATLTNDTFFRETERVIINQTNTREHRVLTHEEALDYLVLVDYYNQLPQDFSPYDLSLVTGWDSSRFKNTRIFMREIAARHLEQMLLAAAKEGDFEMILLRSGYRSYEEQQVTFEHWVNILGLEEAERFSARPGHSEHQTGLAIDLTTRSVNGELVQEFGETPQGIWLHDNAHRFGFIMSYPEGREEDTGFSWEPWHFRWVGIEAATYIFENDLILAEYVLEG